MLEEYVEQCEAVVHFVGAMTGSIPAATSVDDLLARRPGLEAKLAAKGLGHEALKSLTYTQWEAWLAIGLGKDLVIVEPAEGADSRREFGADRRVARLAGRTPEAPEGDRLLSPVAPFTNADNLVTQIVSVGCQKGAGEGRRPMPARQPRNLPFASLGSLFMGREKELEDLRAALTSAKAVAVAAVALCGLGGVGKSRLAIEYAWAHEADYSALLFVRAGDAAASSVNLAALAGADVLDLPERQAGEDREDSAKIDAVLRWIEGHRTWLMILDNVDDEDAVRAVAKLTPRLKGGHLIITGRATNFPASVKTLELGVIALQAATQFLIERTEGKRVSETDDAVQAGALAEDLGGLALGLEQSGAYIARQRIGFARYLTLWREKRESVLKWFDKSLISYEHDVGLAMTWATSVEMLTPESFSPPIRSPTRCWTSRFQVRRWTMTRARRAPASTTTR